MMDKIASKMIVNGLVVIASLMFLSNAGFWGSLVTALVLGAIAYVVGDMFILPATNNTIATISDAVLSYLVLWAAVALTGWTMSYYEILLPVVIIGIFEYMFHFWLLRDGIPGRINRAEMNSRA
ncbi:DUF2512 family protein [Paenibacillus kandeliae]|uniref:DUF2512 family protein n=1 Tax=Paenibacillus kandeliae TaxID=3231269 RepID=UPI003459EBEE